MVQDWEVERETKQDFDEKWEFFYVVSKFANPYSRVSLVNMDMFRGFTKLQLLSFDIACISRIGGD